MAESDRARLVAWTQRVAHEHMTGLSRLALSTNASVCSAMCLTIRWVVSGVDVFGRCAAYIILNLVWRNVGELLLISESRHVPRGAARMRPMPDCIVGGRNGGGVWAAPLTHCGYGLRGLPHVVVGAR